MNEKISTFDFLQTYSTKKEKEILVIQFLFIGLDKFHRLKKLFPLIC